MKPIRQLSVYTSAHLAVDFGCAYFAFSVGVSAADRLLFILLYNFFAFAMQMPLGLIADRLNRNKWVAALGMVLVAAAPLATFKPLVLCVVLGIGNALFHVGGGLDILNRSSEKSSALGVFVSSGALGLYLGTQLSSRLTPWLVSLVLLGLAVAVILLCGASRSDNVELKREKLPRFALVAVGLLLIVVILRSYLPMGADFEWKTGAWSLISVLAVVLGKAAGGFAADRFGARTTALVSLGAAAVLFLFSKNVVCGVLALFFFNMTMPITLWAVARILKTAKGFAFGLLTFGLFLGILPMVLGLHMPFGSPLGLCVLTLISLVLLWLGLIREVRDV